jgi:hypothetical protein
MNLRRWISLPAALLPAATVLVWATFAHAWPEPWLERVRAGEATWSPTWLGCTEFAGEPVHLVMRLLLRATLAMPGASFAAAAWLSAAFAFGTAALVAATLRRSFALAWPSHRIALGLVGLLVATPAHGVVWLAAERLGSVLVPLVFVAALVRLQGEARLRRRALGALLLACVAPFCHTHGVLVAFALLPALHAAMVRAGSDRSAAWLAAAVLLGNVAAVVSVRSGPGIVGELPGLDCCTNFFVRIGASLGDLLPGTNADEVLFGAMVVAVLLVLPRVGDRSGIARERAAVWWSCAWFGLGVLALDVLRYGAAPANGSWREATYGAFLLPIGVVGLLACRFGVGALRVAAGVAVVLALQDWHRGLEDLRVARARGDRVEAAMALPLANLGADPLPLVRDPAFVELARARGWAPQVVEIATVTRAPGDVTGMGGVAAGDANSVRGFMRSTLWQADAAVLVVDAAHPYQVLGIGWPDFTAAQRSRDVPWVVQFAHPLAEGQRVEVFGYRARAVACERFAAPHVLQNGRLVAEVAR